MQNRIRYCVWGSRWFRDFSLILLAIFILSPSSTIQAQHTRLYACSLGSDDPAAFMGGSSIGGGLWQSDDTGRTWKQLGWKHVKCYSVDVVNKSYGKIIYQACGNGVLKSTDGGISWTMLTDWRMSEVMDVAVDQASPKNIYIATPGAIWKSDNAGQDWYEADTDIPYPIFVSRIKIDPTDHLKIYAATENGLYESKDGGIEWEKRSESGERVRDMIISPHGLSAWVEESGAATHFEDKLWQHSSIENNAWTILKYGSRLLYGGEFGVSGIPDSPKNIHSLVSVGDRLFLGSLSGGVWTYSLSKDGVFLRSGLDKLQIWRLKTAEVK